MICCETRELHQLIHGKLLPGASGTSLKGDSYADHQDKEIPQNDPLAAKQAARGFRDATALLPETSVSMGRQTISWLSYEELSFEQRKDCRDLISCAGALS